MPKSNELKNEKITSRFTKAERQKLQSEADLYQMPLSAYCRDKLLKGNERSNYFRRNMYTKLVETTNAVNAVYDYIARTESDLIPKKELIPLIDNIKKGCDAIWNQ